MRPFQGIKLLDITRVIASPFATYQLALLGADVIKIEHPNKGDSVRNRIGHVPEMGKQGMGAGFLAINSNKKSLTVDFGKQAGQQIVRKLAATADVLVQNLRTGAMSRY